MRTGGLARQKSRAGAGQGAGRRRAAHGSEPSDQLAGRSEPQDGELEVGKPHPNPDPKPRCPLLGSVESNSRRQWLRARSATRVLEPSSTWPCIHLHIARGCSGTGGTELSS